MFRMENSTYDFLKLLVTKILPGLGTLYFALCKIWGLPYGTEVVGTISAVTCFLGVCLGISTDNYNSELLLKKAEEEAALEASKVARTKAKKVKSEALKK